MVKRTPKVMHVDLGGQGPTTHTQRRNGVHEEMKGWRVRENLSHPLPLLMQMMMKKKAVMNDLIDILKPWPFQLKSNAQGCPCRAHVLSTKEKDCPVLRRQLRF